MSQERPAQQRSNVLLTALPPADLSLLKPHLKQVALRKGAVLHGPGDVIEQVYFPHSGIVSLVAVMSQGEAVETATIGREGVIGSFSGFGPRRAHMRAIVQVDGTASCIAVERFRAAFKISSAIRDAAIRYNEMMLIQVQQSVACNALHDVEERLSRWLLQARDRVDDNTIRLTHEFLSQMLGVRRTTVTVTANALQQAGLIRYRRGRIEIVDRHGLEARACECYAAVRRDIDQVVPQVANGAIPGAGPPPTIAK